MLTRFVSRSYCDPWRFSAIWTDFAIVVEAPAEHTENGSDQNPITPAQQTGDEATVREATVRASPECSGCHYSSRPF